MFKLTAKNKKLLRKASRQQVEDYFVKLPTRKPFVSFLRRSNRYRVSCTDRYEADVTKNRVNDKQVRNYIAASCPGHLIDGWSFLGRAIDCALRGDQYSSMHLAYYAELRAAMALLASEGIGIFDKKHPVVESTGKTAPLLLSGTHQITWHVLTHWAVLERSGLLLDRLVAPLGISLSTWLDRCGFRVPVRALGKRWLTTWGMDLHAFAADRDTRNLASYRPSAFRSPPPSDASETLQFVESLWRLFEPSDNTRFPNLESALLRRAIRSLQGPLPRAPTLIANLGIDAPQATALEAFFGDPDEPMPLLYADIRSSVEDARGNLQIISRAALLLFLASGAVRHHFDAAGISREALAFSWSRGGTDRGLWASDDVPLNPIDKWADIDECITETKTWRDRGGVTMRSMRQEQPLQLNAFGAIELAGIWGMLP